jgi:hypothetical protein
MRTRDIGATIMIIVATVMCGTYAIALIAPTYVGDAGPLALLHLVTIPLSLVLSVLLIRARPLLAGIVMVLSLALGYLQFWPW